MVRPRTSCPEDDELIILGEDLIKWCSEETKELRCRFANWYTERGFIEKEWKRIIDNPTFRPYYETARAKLALKYVDGSINPSIGNRIAGYYIPEAKAEDRELLKYKSDLAKEEKKEEIKSLSELQLAKMAFDGQLKQE